MKYIPAIFEFTCMQVVFGFMYLFMMFILSNMSPLLMWACFVVGVVMSVVQACATLMEIKSVRKYGF